MSEATSIGDALLQPRRKRHQGSSWLRILGGLLGSAVLLLLIPSSGAVNAGNMPAQMTIAVIGDYGCLASTCASLSSQKETAVAAIVHSWSPDAIFTVGDNSYENGTAAEVPIDQQPYAADVNAGRLFQVTGNHDWGNQCADSTWIKSSTSYFGLPPHYVAHLGNGLLDFFATDLNCGDVDGYSSGSTQASQYVSALESSSAVWRITGGHQPFYSSGLAGTQQYTHWAINPLVDLYLSGHDHDWEHLVEGGQNFVVDGVGGSDLHAISGSPVSGSVWRDDQDFGAVRLTITQSTLTVDFVSLSGTVLHSFTQTKDASRGFIAGTVTDSASGHPLNGATVSDGASSITTSPDGTYVLTGVPVGSYTVTASAVGHVSASHPLTVSGGTISNSNFSLAPSASARVGSIKGNVTDSVTHQPVASATVSYPGGSTTTDAAGAYLLTGVAPGSYQLTAGATNYSTQSRQTSVTTGISYVQGAVANAGGGNGSGATAVTATLPGPVTAGNRIVVGVRVDSNPAGAVVSGVSDGVGNAYTVHASVSNNKPAPAGFQSQGSIWSSVVNVGAGSTLSVTAMSTSSADISIAVAEYAGLSTAAGNAVVDGVASAGGVSTGSPASGPTSPTTSTNDLSVGIYADGGSGVAIAAGTGWTSRLNNSPNSVGTIVLDDETQTLGSTPNAQFNSTSPTSWVAVAVNFIGLAPPPTVEDFPLVAASGSVIGVVTDTLTGQPIAGATVSYTGGTATADGTGRYTLSNTVEGTYPFTASAPRYGSVTASATVISAQSTTLNFSLSQSPGVITGVVTDARSGLAVVGAVVAVQGASTKTTNSGNYTLSQVPPGGYSLTINAGGYFPQSAAISLPAGGTVTQSFVLAPSTAAAAGTVIDSVTNQPLGGATVSSSGGSTTADAAGNYLLGGFSAGTFTVTASAPNHVSQGQQVTFASGPKYRQGSLQNAGSGNGSGATSVSTGLPAGVTANDRIVVAVRVDSNPNGALVGTVTDSAGNGYTKHIVASNVRPGGFQAQLSIWSAVVTAGAGSRLTVTATSTASADISIAVAEYAGLSTAGGPGAVDVSAGAGGIATINPASGPTAAVAAGNELAVGAYGDGGAGVGVAAGTGWAGRLNNSPSGVGTIILEDQTEAAGAVANATFGDTSPTKWAAAVVVFTGGTPPTVTQSFVLAPTGGVITGMVTNSATGQAISGASVTWSGGTATTNAAGSYTLANVPAGTYSVTVTAAAYTSATATAAVSAGSATTVNFPLTASPGSVNGTVIDSLTNKPIAGSVLSYSGGSATADGSGNYVLSNLQPGTYSVTASASGYGSVTSSVTVTAGGSGTLDFSLTPVTPVARYIQGSLQNAGSGNGSGATSVSSGFGAGVAANDRIVVAVRVDSNPNGSVVGSVTDSAGNLYTKHVVASNVRPDGFQVQLSIWSAVVTAGAGSKLTVTATSTASADISIALAEYAGLSTVSGAGAVDVSAGAGAIGTSNPASGPTAPVTAANELAVGAYGDGGAGVSVTAGAGWAGRLNNSPSSVGTILLEDQTEAAGATANATFSDTSPTKWAAAVVVFRLP